MHISVIYKQRWNCSTFSALMSQSLANEKRFNRYNANGKPLQLEWIVFKLWKLLLQFKICWNNLKISHFGLKISRALAISVMLPLKPEYTKKKVQPYRWHHRIQMVASTHPCQFCLRYSVFSNKLSVPLFFHQFRKYEKVDPIDQKGQDSFKIWSYEKTN